MLEILQILFPGEHQSQESLKILPRREMVLLGLRLQILVDIKINIFLMALGI